MTSAPGTDSQPAWSRDGSLIAFTSDREGDSEVYVMAANGALQTNLTDDFSEDFAPAWTPDGRILFTSDRSANWDLEIANADGTGRHALRATGADDWDPSWSPDGRRIAYTHDYDLWSVRPRGGRAHRLFANPTLVYSPEYSPRRGLIAFAREEANDEIFVARTDGTHRRRLTWNRGADYSPTWSPNARRIAFVHERRGTGSVWAMSANGRRKHRLVAGPAYDPAWSPSRRWIAFARERDDGDSADIYIVRPNGRGLRRVTDAAAAYDGTPAWSPDGQWIVFSRTGADQSSALYVVRPDGTGFKRAVDPRFQPYLPAWQPLR